MKAGHISEEAIQQYVLDVPGCAADIIDHIGCCETCKTKVANYRSIFASIPEQPRPAFEFDVAGLVLSQLQGKKKQLPRMDWSLYLLICAAFSLLAVPLYCLRKDIAVMFAGMTPITIGLATLSVILVFLFQGLEFFKKYKWRSDALNY